MNINQIFDLILQNLTATISIPIIAALIGWVTNYIAVKMIFRPRRPISIFGLKIQGLVPRRQRELAESIGETIQRDLLSHKDVEKVLQSQDVENDVAKMIEEQVDKFLQNFITKNPMVAMFLQGDLLSQIKQALVDQMRSSIPALLDSVMQRVEKNLDFKQIVQDKIVSFDLSKLEDIIYRISAKELKTIELLGGVLGFIVGLVQVLIMLVSQIYSL